MQKFCEALAEASWVKEERFAKLAQRCEGWMNARLAAYDKCGFFDPSLRNGGPDPNVEYKATTNNHWGEENEKLDLGRHGRRRRSAEDCSNWDGKTDYHKLLIYYNLFYNR